MSSPAIDKYYTSVQKILEKFNTYRFADYKEQVIELLKRVTMVSVGVTAYEPGWRW